MAVQVLYCRVRLEREANHKFVIKVQVLSHRREGLMASADVDPGLANTHTDLLRMVGHAGAGGAEYLDRNYGDQHDPSQAYLYAVRAFLEEAKRIGEATKAAPKKVKRLTDLPRPLFDSLYGEEEQAWFDRIKFQVKKGESITPEEEAVLVAMLQKIHQSNQNLDLEK